MLSFEPINKRCVGVGLMILASSIGLRWFSPEPWVGKSAVLLGLHVAAMALLSAGAIGVCRVAAARVCALWAAGGVSAIPQEIQEFRPTVQIYGTTSRFIYRHGAHQTNRKGIPHETRRFSPPNDRGLGRWALSIRSNDHDSLSRCGVDDTLGI